ncbi:restriction endonuclease [Thioalkalivibrio sp. XN279]|uniref:restriction endonuclease n=1 Tax=Thioalkalivibrio sp. XN279 TaxID=2714953 RepID=UPI00140A1948|nr:restriction endonuclease [Thioalkalivibrio sp. XN279]NHA14140.1 hypothetical protein [Thioalkalivibrio sp. XN279]
MAKAIASCAFSQRRREIEAETPYEARRLAKELEKFWQAEFYSDSWRLKRFRNVLSTFGPLRAEIAESFKVPCAWKKTALRWDHAPPRPVKLWEQKLINGKATDIHPRWRSPFGPNVLGDRGGTATDPNASTSNQAFLSDYQAFLDSIETASRHRIDVALSEAPEFPVPPPQFEEFPIVPTEAIAPKQAPDRPPPPTKDSDPPSISEMLALMTSSSTREARARDLTEKYAEWKKRIAEIDEQAEAVSAYNRWAQLANTDRKAFWDYARHEYEKARQELRETWSRLKTEWDTQIQSDRERFQCLREKYRQRKPSSVEDYFRANLDAIPLPGWCPRNYEVHYDSDQSVLLIDYQLPNIPRLSVLKWRELKRGGKTVSANKAEAKQFAESMTYLIALRLLWETAWVDESSAVSLVAINGFVVSDDSATGQRRSDVILSVAAPPETLKQIVLHKVDPQKCFRSFKGISASKIHELVPVQPVIQLDKSDRRLVDSREVLDSVGDENLATMDWQDFEHLIRELFERKFSGNGAEVRVTQASRDRGVDAIIFDPDPLTGGKIVIQAKRYAHTVDVSAVRDLYGTVLNEGAMKGILVTTSNYGRDAFEFANGKPLTLLNGQNLLALLEAQGYKFKIDLNAARQLLRAGRNQE